MSALLTAASHAAGPTVDAASKKSSSGSSVLLIVVIVAVLGFLILNARRRSRAQSVKAPTWDVGAMIVTRAGLIARLVEQTDDYVVLQLEDGTRARYVPQAVARLWEEPTTADDGPSPASGVDLRKPPAGGARDGGDDRHADGEPPAGSGPLAD